MMKETAKVTERDTDKGHIPLIRAKMDTQDSISYGYAENIYFTDNFTT